MRWIGLLTLLAAGCVGAIERSEGEGAPQSGTTVTEVPLTCDESKPAIGPAPLRRLSRTELRKTLRDLFAVPLPAIEIPPDSLVDGFDNNEVSQLPSPLWIEQWSTVASQFSGVAAIGCKPGSEAERPACAKSFVESFVRRAYRRPLEPDEITRFTAFVVDQAKTNGFELSIAMLVEAVLQSPAFLYRPESGAVDPSRPEFAALNGYEIASRLSYLLWQTMPDATLFDAAANGELATRDGVEKHARRMLADPRARDAIADFHRQWLKLDAMSSIRRDKSLFPAFTDELPAALRDASAKYVDHVFWNGTFESLLGEPKAMVNDLIAPLYGVAKPGSSTPVLVDLDPSQRAGILTHVGFLASKAHEKFDAPILRGVFVLDRFLCAPPPPLPPDVTNVLPPPGDVPLTTRQRIEQSHAVGGCKSCHDSIDGVGFLFDHYDAVGAWRDTENGVAVDATGSISGLGAIDGKYDGAVSLSKAMAKSDRVKQCFSRQWFRFAHGRTERKEDACAVAAMVKALDAAKGNMRELLVQLVLADGFRFRPVVKVGE